VNNKEHGLDQEYKTANCRAEGGGEGGKPPGILPWIYHCIQLLGKRSQKPLIRKTKTAKITKSFLIVSVIIEFTHLAPSPLTFCRGNSLSGILQPRNSHKGVQACFTLKVDNFSSGITA